METITERAGASHTTDDPTARLQQRDAPLALDGAEFRALGHELVDRIAAFYDTLPSRPATREATPESLRQLLPAGAVPATGTAPGSLLDEAADLLFAHSLHSGSPRFWGYVFSSAAPIGALADLLAAAVNPNVGAWALSPLATEIEAQTISWIAELLGYPAGCGGLLVSGGNMANIVGILTARHAYAARHGWDVRADGVGGGVGRRLRIYASAEAHTWLHKAADMCGLGTEAIRWVATDAQHRIDPVDLLIRLREDTAAGEVPFLVVASAGTVATGAVDPLPELAAICREFDLWFHVDGAYGGFAALLLDGAEDPGIPDDLRGIREADSVAVDPHKWLYAPLEAGCVLVRDASALRDTFSFHPLYYRFDGEGSEPPLNYHEYGPQNSRGFRALKVWLALRQVGRDGYARMIADDIHLSHAMYRMVQAEPALQEFTQDLSITTFRYVPTDLLADDAASAPYLNDLNAALLTRLQQGGEAYLSNAVIDGQFVLRACIVNFRTALADVAALPGYVVQLGHELDAKLRPTTLR
jgi:aromatic-L-amino-acid decarboxylase